VKREERVGRRGGGVSPWSSGIFTYLAYGGQGGGEKGSTFVRACPEEEGGIKTEIPSGSTGGEGCDDDMYLEWRKRERPSERKG